MTNIIPFPTRGEWTSKELAVLAERAGSLSLAIDTFATDDGDPVAVFSMLAFPEPAFSVSRIGALYVAMDSQGAPLAEGRDLQATVGSAVRHLALTA